MAFLQVRFSVTQASVKQWDIWILDNPVVYKDEKTNQLITVPSGFLTDGATVPRIFWFMLPKLGPYSMAAAVHDYLIFNIRHNDPQYGFVERYMADDLFYRAMRDMGISYIKAKVLWAAVRLNSYRIKYFGYWT